MTTPPPQPAVNNGLATAGFILALCAVALFWFPIVGQIVWLLGLIFSAVGLSKANKTEGRPRFRLAVAGLAISLGGAVLTILAITGVLVAAA